jgi:hypothetical protein
VFNQFNVGEFFLPDDYWYPGFRDAYVQVLDAYFNKQANIPDEAIEQNWFSRLSEDEAIQEYRAFLAKQEL